MQSELAGFRNARSPRDIGSCNAPWALARGAEGIIGRGALHPQQILPAYRCRTDDARSPPTTRITVQIFSFCSPSEILKEP